MNYELLWEDDDPETVTWVQEEFDALWDSPQAFDLANCPFITKEILRITKRKVVSPKKWKQEPDPVQAAAAAAVETPLYRREQGLWPHQKYFCRLALERHRLGGARLVLADQVGLGKTIQLAMAAMLMALEDPEGGPVLVLAPKPLLRQWQEELMELLLLPSARWDGSAWIDENEIKHRSGDGALLRCPRRIGLVSQGLVLRRNSSATKQLLSLDYTCVIVDEAHRSRRRKIPSTEAGNDEVNEPAEPNNLMHFLRQVGGKTKSLLLATATPVQLHPVEAWDLLHTLSQGNDGVLGGWTNNSPWFRASRCLAVATGEERVPTDDDRQGWEFVRDPLPSRHEDPAFRRIRDALGAPDNQWQFRPESLTKLSPAIRNVQLGSNLLPDYGELYNPLLRCIVRRERRYLEEQINPTTGAYYLPKVEVRQFGNDETGSVTLGGYLKDAYDEAINFCDLLKGRVKGAGFFQSLLLRRLGSSIEAGRCTVRRLLGEDIEAPQDEDEDDAEELGHTRTRVGRPPADEKEFKNFTEDELASLTRCLHLLQEGGNQDPKLEAVISYLLGTAQDVSEPWRERGCILFSQYYETVKWVGGEIAAHPEFSGMDIGLYAGANRSGFWRGGQFQRCNRDDLKDRVRSGDLKLLFGTDAASEGLNLQKLGTLINIDLPWNPTRLEQRKGRIQRIGQRHSEIWIANLRYRDSVEDRVHQVLSSRLEAIHDLFGQIPDTLGDEWIYAVLEEKGEEQKLIDQTLAVKNPFDQKYSRVEDDDWDACSEVLDPISVAELMSESWK